MTFSDLIKKSVLEGFSGTDVSTEKMIVTLVVTYILAMYVYLVYRFITKNTFFYKNYGISMAIMAVITAGIILAMQSSLVISLGMVGALSIVRFRTAVKDPLDLLFLFWSIGIGIICGAGLYKLAVITSVTATVGILLFELFPVKKSTRLLVVNSSAKDNEGDLFRFLQENTRKYQVRSKNVNQDGVDYVVELSVKGDGNTLVNHLSDLPGIDSVSLLLNDIDTGL